MSKAVSDPVLPQFQYPVAGTVPGLDVLCSSKGLSLLSISKLSGKGQVYEKWICQKSAKITDNEIGGEWDNPTPTSKNCGSRGERPRMFWSHQVDLHIAKVRIFRFNLNFTLRFSLLALGWDKVLSVFTFLAVCYGVCVGLGAVEIISKFKHKIQMPKWIEKKGN